MILLELPVMVAYEQQIVWYGTLTLTTPRLELLVAYTLGYLIIDSYPPTTDR
jgi:hypothetical protein